MTDIRNCLMLMLRDKTDDVTYFLHATSCGQKLQFKYCFKCDLAPFSRCKTLFSSNIMPPKYVELGPGNGCEMARKKLVSDVRVNE